MSESDTAYKIRMLEANLKFVKEVLYRHLDDNARINRTYLANSLPYWDSLKRYLSK